MSDPNQSYNYNNNGSFDYSGGGDGGGGVGGSNGSSYSYAGTAYPTYEGTSSGAQTNMTGAGGTPVLRRRAPAQSYYSESSSRPNNGNDSTSSKGSKRAVVERLDFMFPKVDKEFTVQTKGGGVLTFVAYGLIVALCLAEVITWKSQNGREVSQTLVDKSLGKKMRVNLNITFPSLACDDLHLDIIDVAGDSQLDIEDTLKKKKLHMNGRSFSNIEIDAETNKHRLQQEEKERVLKEKLPKDYCGPCYGAAENEEQCCQTCDEVLVAYSNKKWRTDLLKFTAEQCIREGRDKQDPKKMTKGQGCNLYGYMTLNRVSGNFHIAMGEGIERDGRHIHTYLPEDAPNFNASHIIHHLSFGNEDGADEPLNGVTKIVTENTGTTGLFQYFIKIVPTAYVGEDAFPKALPRASGEPGTEQVDKVLGRNVKTLETNRYYFTERFMPLMTELLEDQHMDKDAPKTAAVHAGHTGGHDSHHHAMKQNSVLPGVFFIYEIYPFAVKIRRSYVPLTHLLIRLMATVGGVFTLVRWADSLLYERGTHKNHPR